MQHGETTMMDHHALILVTDLQLYVSRGAAFPVCGDMLNRRRAELAKRNHPSNLR